MVTFKQPKEKLEEINILFPKPIFWVFFDWLIYNKSFICTFFYGFVVWKIHSISNSVLGYFSSKCIFFKGNCILEDDTISIKNFYT